MNHRWWWDEQSAALLGNARVRSPADILPRQRWSRRHHYLWGHAS